MVRLIKVDGTITEHTDDEFNSLEKMQSAVGGLIEIVCRKGRTVWLCDEEGLLKNKSINVTASIAVGRQIVGDVLVVDKSLLN